MTLQRPKVCLCLHESQCVYLSSRKQMFSDRLEGSGGNQWFAFWSSIPCNQLRSARARANSVDAASAPMIRFQTSSTAPPNDLSPQS